MKRILIMLAALLALWAPSVYAQTQSQPDGQSADEAEDETFAYAYELIMTGLSLNESCKSVLDPKH